MGFRVYCPQVAAARFLKRAEALGLDYMGV